ncbi:MAG TPA: T9SS type A sorting domain-containing protein [Ignavibacteriaceae bacterium]|nr:T9SS type A sorting domain-containing protein [Ignavibacteriaceae bacterium]
MYNNINWVTYTNAVTINNFMFLNNIFFTPEATSEPNVQFGYRKTDGTLDAPVKFGTNVIIDDNCYYEAMNPNNTYTKRFYTHNHLATGTCRGSLDNISYSLPNWESAFSVDSHSIELDPLFTSTSTFLLDNTLGDDHSPCLNTGTELPSSYDAGSYIIAYDGTERPLGIIDMGANEQHAGDWSPPKNISLKGSLNAYPNPFNPFTTIEYYIPKDGFVSLKIYNILGKEVVTLINENKTIGKYNVVFNGEDLSSGIYFYHLSSVDFSEIKKFVLLK